MGIKANGKALAWHARGTWIDIQIFYFNTTIRNLSLQSVSWSLAEFRHNKIVQSPHENYFNVCRQHKEK